MTAYYKYTNHEEVDCYYEVDQDLKCLSAVFISTVYVTPYSYYVEDERYHLPDSLTKEKLEYMEQVSKEEYLEQMRKKYTGKDEITFLLKHFLYERD